MLAIGPVIRLSEKPKRRGYCYGLQNPTTCRVMACDTGVRYCVSVLDLTQGPKLRVVWGRSWIPLIPGTVTNMNIPGEQPYQQGITSSTYRVLDGA